MARKIGRAVGGLVITAALLVGVPYLLVTRVGWPLPTSIPDFGRVWESLQIGIEREVVINVLAVIIWISWTQIAISFLVEGWASIRGRAARPIFGVPAIAQGLAKHLIAWTIAVSVLSPGGASPGDIIDFEDPAGVVLDLDAERQGTLENPDRPDDTNTTTVRASAGDSWWSLAERHLGDGLEWKKVRAMNVGRVVADGVVINPHTDRIQPGWSLLVPADRTVRTLDPTEDRDAADGPRETRRDPDKTIEITVEKGDNQWDLAEAYLEEHLGREVTNAEIAEYWRKVVDMNMDNLLPPEDPNLIYPAQRLELPALGDDALVGDDSDLVADRAVEEPPPPDQPAKPDIPPPDQPDDTKRPSQTPPRVIPGPDLGAPGDQAPIGDDSQQRTPTSPPPGTPPDQPADEQDGKQVVSPLEPDQPDRVVEQPGGEDGATDPNRSAAPDEESEEEVGAVPEPLEGPSASISPWTTRGEGVSEEWLAVSEPTPDWAPAASVEAGPTLWVTEEEEILAAGATAASPGADLIPGAAVATGAGAAGAALLSSWLRQRRQFRRAMGDTTELEDVEVEDLADVGHWALGAAFAEFENPPVPLAVVCDPLRTRLVVDGAGDRVPLGWTRSRVAGSWDLPTTELTNSHGGDGALRWPGLLGLGRTEAGQVVWTNLEAAPITSVVGAPGHVRSLLCKLAANLVVNPVVDVVWVGDGGPESIPSVSSVAAAVEHLSTMEVDRIATSPGRSVGTAVDFTAVFAPDAPVEERSVLTSAILRVGRDRGVAAVVGWETSAAGDPWSWMVRGPGVLDLPTMPGLVVVEDVEAETPEPVLAPQIEHPEPAAVELRVLGPVHVVVDGATAVFRRRQTIELIALLVDHPDGLSTDRIMSYLWPDDDPQGRRPVLQQLASDARKALGRDVMPPATKGTYRVNLGSDLRRFEEMVSMAGAAGSEEERLAHLEAAVELIGGRPFETSREWLWVTTEGVMASVGSRLHEAVHTLGRAKNDRGGYATALNATERGVLVDRYCQRCWELRLEAAEKSGDDTLHRHLITQRDAVFNLT